jgi:hypothetical protein
MTSADNIPKRSGYGDVFGFFFIVLSIALGLQAYGEIFQFAGLRASGIETEGRWIDNYTEPNTNAPIVVYAFDVGEETYRNRQVIPENLSEGVGSGDAVAVVYLPDNPEISRLAGTEGYSMFYIAQFIVSAIVAIFALQYVIARKMGWVAWMLWIVNSIRK